MSDAEVRAKVIAQADAWAPDAEVFEHAKCRALRLAPDPCDEPETRDPLRSVITGSIISALVEVRDFAVSHDLLITNLSFAPPRHDAGPTGPVQVDLGGYSPAEFLRWADHLDVERLSVESSPGSSHVRFRIERWGIVWRARTWVAEPDHAVDYLGGAPVEWRYVTRSGARRNTGNGHTTPADFATGLRVLGRPSTVEV